MAYWASIFSITILFLALAGGIGHIHLCLAKECTNIPTQLSSHTFRSAILSASHSHSHSHSSSLLPPPPSLSTSSSSSYFSEELAQRSIFSSSSSSRKVKLLQSNPSVLKEVSLHNVTLLPGSLQAKAQQTNLEYLLLLDVDRLVWSFRVVAGTDSPPGDPYGGWEQPQSELRGHFVGHYMSATALMWASTHNMTLWAKMNAVVDALHECQEKIGNGYLSAFPSEFFDRFEQIQPVWAPYYTIHKIMAGLLDQYVFSGNKVAFTMAIKMADYFSKRVQNVIEQYTIERHWRSLNEETGGMNDVLYRLYTLTEETRYLDLAHLFDKPCFLGLLAVQEDSLSGFHANTHIPVVVGAQMRYEVTGDNIYKDIGTYFMEIVNSSHVYATAGTSQGEFWTDPLRLGDATQPKETETEESCTTYNMLKVSRHLFRWTKEMKYADYYERAITNGVLSIQRGEEPGVMIYMLPLGHGTSKAISYHGWGTRFDSFWCCYGTGIESFSKLGDSIYFQESGPIPGLYIVQFVSSKVFWDATGFYITQNVDIPSARDRFFHLDIDVSMDQKMKNQAAKDGVSSSLHIRIPLWTSSSNSSITLNGGSLQMVDPGNFLTITRTWQSGDVLSIILPSTLRAESIKDDRESFASVYAFFFGPYLLAGLTSGEWDISGVDLGSLSSWILPLPECYNDQVYSFTQVSSGTSFVLRHSEGLVHMGGTPYEGTNEAMYSTFRVVEASLQGGSSGFSCDPTANRSGLLGDLDGKAVSLELFDQPGRYLAHTGAGQAIQIIGHPGNLSEGAVFVVRSGNNGRSVLFEAASQKGCFLSQDDSTDQKTIVLKCASVALSSTSYDTDGGFIVSRALASYDPMSFIAQGSNRNFLLFPLLAYKDQNYTVYFNVSSS